MQKNAVWSLCFLALFLTGCFNPLGSETADQKLTSGNSVDLCGTTSPSYYYFTEIVTTIPYPHNYVADTSEFFTLKNLTPEILIPHGMTIDSRPRPSLFLDELDRSFSNSELECWASQGDQIAAYELGKSQGLGDFYHLIRQIKDTKEASVGVGNFTFNPDLIARLHRSKGHYLVAAKHSDNFCPVGYQAGWKALPQCQPSSMVTVFEHGVPMANSELAYLYKYGPDNMRDAEIAKYYEVLSGLQGRFDNFHDFYQCETYKIVKKNERLFSLFHTRLGSDVFYPYGITEEKDIPVIRAGILERLSKCPT